ncbi:hypothetical protein [Paenibacillus sp. MMS20-IR301]|uniref:flavodoxin family protein n=1 Tax=Paenibacillus sp. MMS20-IR301 TaxID=2895946 RepID=UPI0028EF6B4C|nr:hypothetical protein [Paenibacillus sp. MMS20-IR301]WNS45237.1 hypothetical protein LOS79_08195 [Paenibacillus sp. MMS20-IR301]
MKIAIVSYSFTGNNDKFAASLASELPATHIRITTQKPFAMKSIVLDMIFSRTPKVHPHPDSLQQYDLILFVAPVWMGNVASPVRAYLHALQSKRQAYGLLSISGGADGENPKLMAELLKRTGASPAIVLDQHIKDYITLDSPPTRQDTSAYKISDTDAVRLSENAIKEIKKLIAPV